MNDHTCEDCACQNSERYAGFETATVKHLPDPKTMVRVEVMAWLPGKREDTHLFTYTTRGQVDDPARVLDDIREALQ